MNTRAKGLRGRMIVAALCVTAALAASGCGYALAGRGSFLPEYIRVVGIPAFGNKTTTFDIDRVLTDAVRTEFASRGRYTVKPDTDEVDAVLVGTVTDVRLAATAFTDGSQASRQTLIVTLALEFRDVREAKLLWSNSSMQHREEFEVSTSLTGNDVSAFFGQNTNAMQRLAQDFSRRIVTSILEAF
jgi:hypothetical protein